MDEPTDQDAETAAALARIERAIARTRLAIFWERLWPRLALALGMAGAFLAAAWLGLFAALPDLVRLALAAVFVVAFAAAAVLALLTPRPDRAIALARLDGGRGDHRPLASLLDAQGLGADDPASRALWRLHLRRLAADVGHPAAVRPEPRLDRADPYALRAAVILALAVGWTAAAGHRLDSLVDAFRLPAPMATDAGVYAWITPPAYTGLAPRSLADDGAPVRVPEGSRLTVRLAGLADPAVRLVPASGAPTELTPAPGAEGREAGFETTLAASARLEILAAGRPLRDVPLEVVADRPPEIALVEAPGATSKGALHLAYRAADDYRLASARALLAPTGNGSAAAGARPLVALPEIPLSLPPRGGDGAETVRDLSAHPFAGGRVSLTLEARDDAGHVGRSPAVDIVLPGRSFANPLAAMLADERRRLAADANAAGAVADTVETASYLGAGFIDRPGAIIALRVVSQTIRHAVVDDDLRAALDLMWTVALGIENGDAADAGERLRQARAAMRAALERNAPPAEIARLADDLRAALSDYLQALADEARRNPSRMADLAAPRRDSGRSLSQRDLDRMVEQLKELSDLGQRDAARELMSRLDDMLDNLSLGAAESADGKGGDSDGSGAAARALDALADLIRRQQDLMNDTHRLSPEGRAGDDLSLDGDAERRALDGLKDRQEALGRDLGALADRLARGGLGGGERLGAAGGAMKGAAGSLGDGDAESAVGNQGAAIGALRDGARELAKEAAGTAGRSQNEASGSDPLGRPAGRRGPDFGDATSLPGEIAAERARRLLDELRRRYSESGRPAVELDYLRRLITPF